MGQKTDQIFERGQLFLEKGNYEQALRLFNQVLNREPKYKEALKNKVLIKIAEAPREEAKESLQFALNKFPEDDELHDIAGSFHINYKDFNTGVKHLKRSVQLNENNELAHYGLGIVSANHHSDHAQAIKHFSKAIEQNPEFAEAFFNRGCSHLMEDHVDKARQDLNTAKKLGHPDAEDILDKYVGRE